MQIIKDLARARYTNSERGETLERIFVVSGADTTRPDSVLLKATKLSGIPRKGDQHPQNSKLKVVDVSASTLNGEPGLCEIIARYAEATRSESASSSDAESARFEFSYDERTWDFRGVWKTSGGFIPSDIEQDTRIREELGWSGDFGLPAQRRFRVLKEASFDRLGFTLRSSRDVQYRLVTGTSFEETWRDRNGNLMKVTYSGKHSSGTSTKTLKAEVPTQHARFAVTVTGRRFAMDDVFHVLGRVNKSSFSDFKARTLRCDQVEVDGERLTR